MPGAISYASPREKNLMYQNPLIQQSATKLGLDPEAFLSREKMLQDKEEEDRMNAMDPNKSKFMGEEEKQKKLNAYKNRRFLELGIGHIPGEGQVFALPTTAGRMRD
jgi:hypothetical protein